MVVAASYDETLKYGAQTPFSDQLTFKWEGGMWEYDPYHNSIITAGNGGTKPTQAAFTIFYNQGVQRYDLEQTLQPDEQMWIDVGKLIREQVSDKNGKTLPSDLKMGSYEFRDLTNTGVGTLFEGKIIYDKTYGHVVYGCGTCCGYATPKVFYDPIGVPLSATASDGVNAYENCNRAWENVSDSFYNNWATGNTAIATVNTYGTHSGVSVGSTSSNTSAYLDGTKYAPRCPQLLFAPGGGVNVMPKIMFTGQNITGTTQSVVVGQQIALTASYGNITPTSQSWSVLGTIIGGFSTASNNGGPTSVSLNAQSTTFYWVAAANSQMVTFTLNYGSSQTASASATFNVAGPTSVSVSVSPTTSGLLRILNNGTTNALIEFGSTLGTPGVQFTAHATSPSQATGTYEWAQLINQNNYAYTIGTTTTFCNGPAGLDNSFPTSTGFYFSDSPWRGLPSADNKFTWTWNATAYFMWNPGLTNSIAVPLGYVSWQFFSDTIQNGPNTWFIQADSSASAGSFQASSSYIQWTSTATNGSLGSCQ
jgi:hypothetical protein